MADKTHSGRINSRILSVMASICRPTLMTGNGVKYNVGDSASFI